MNSNKTLWAAALTLFVAMVFSCSDDPESEPEPEPVPVVASFSSSLEEYTATFTNESVGADTFSWDFGDTETSVEKDPVHTYAEAGEYTITMIASNKDNEKTVTATITVEEVGQDPMTLLTGGDTKTWVLAPQGFAVSFGNPGGKWYDGLPAETTAVETWWGNTADQVAGRECLFNNEYTFTAAGAFTRDINDGLWKEWRVFDADGGEGCAENGDDLITRLDNDVSAWRDGAFTFEIATFAADSIFDYTISTAGKGGYIGHYTSGVETSNYDANDAHDYGILSISEDRLELISWGWGGDAVDNEIPVDQSDRWYKVVLVPASQ